MSETIEVRRRRLIHRSRYTGMKETDLLLSRFAARYVPAFTAQQLDCYERLLAEPDPLIFDWVAGRESVPAAHEHDVMALLKNFMNYI